MSSHSQKTKLDFDKEKQLMKVEDADAMKGASSKNKESAKGHSQDADRHTKISHPKSSK